MSDLAKIEEAVLNYFEGVRENDIHRLKKAFHESNISLKGIMEIEGQKTLVSWRDNDVISTLIEHASDKYTGHIKSINIYAENAAFVLFNFDNTFTDGLQLFKINGEWKIINKTFV